VCCHYVMSVLGVDSGDLRCLQDCVVNDRMHVLCEQNPFICGEVPEADVFLACYPMGLRKRDMEGYAGEFYCRELGILWAELRQGPNRVLPPRQHELDQWRTV
jgi:hypothetical protein